MRPTTAVGTAPGSATVTGITGKKSSDCSGTYTQHQESVIFILSNAVSEYSVTWAS